MRTERLRELAAVVEGRAHTAPYAEFDDWRTHVSTQGVRGAADDIRAHGGFHMAYYLATEDDTCATAACLAGWTVALWGGRGQYPKADLDELADISETAARVLDIDARTGGQLFNPERHIDLHGITPQQAARACRRLADGDDPGRIWDHVPGWKEDRDYRVLAAPVDEDGED